MIYRHLPVDGLLGLVSYSDEVRVSIEQDLNKRAMPIEVKKKPDWYL